MGNQWAGLDGWPCDFSESQTGAALFNALRKIPGGEKLTDEEVKRQADLLYSTYSAGRDEELPRNRAASQMASEAEIGKLADMAEKMANHIYSLKKPAVRALYGEGSDVFETARILRKLQEHSRFAFGVVEAEDSPQGAPKKVSASGVTHMSAAIFRDISGKWPTYTTPTVGGEVTGGWPIFLGSVFAALHVEASVEAQVKSLR